MIVCVCVFTLKAKFPGPDLCVSGEMGTSRLDSMIVVCKCFGSSRCKITID